MKRKQSKSDLEKQTLLEMFRVYYAKKGFRVSSVKQTPIGTWVVRFPDGGPSGLKKTRHDELSIRQVREALEG